jgi:hypothetical protein
MHLLTRWLVLRRDLVQAVFVGALFALMYFAEASLWLTDC